MNARRAGALAFAAMALSGARPLSAQSIILSNPEAWTQPRTLTIGVTDSVRVTGTALHPGGIAAVQVAGVSATLQRGDFNTAVDFSISMQIPDTLTRVVIRVTPTSGSPYEEGFPVEFRPAVRIQQPSEWRTGGALNATEGDQVSVSGVAIYPGGVRSITVAGRDAVILRNARYTHRVEFTVGFPAPFGQTDAVVRIVPNTGDPYETRYAWFIGRAPAAPTTPTPPAGEQPAGRGGGGRAGGAGGAGGGGGGAGGGAGRRADPPPTTTPAPAPAPTATNASPWPGMKKRGIAYGAAAALGAGLSMVVTTSQNEKCETIGAGQDCFLITEKKPAYRAVGLGLIGAAALAATIDAFRTSKSASRTTTTGSSGVHIDVPSLAPDGRGVALSLLRLRF
jgi:hypothetical protein